MIHPKQITPTADSTFSLSEARGLVKDLFQPNPLIYWIDFLTTYAAALFCFQQVRGGHMLQPHQGFTGEPSQILFFIASCLLFYRASMFIHELVHQRSESLRAFRFVWNLLCGIPFLTPTFIYYTHVDHHRRSHYGTEHDGEYLPLALRAPAYILFYLSWSFVIPLVVIGRFLILTPLCWISPRIRQWTTRHLSSLVMDPTYIRPLPTAKTRRIMRVQETACFLWCLGFAVVPPLALGRWPLPFLVHAYLMAVVIVLLNSLRTLGSHRWQNAGGEMTFLGQLLDSVNYPKSPWITELWGPVGTRYHALHHLFPSLPYHAMPTAHRRLMQQLPPGSPYRQTNAPSLSHVILSLWRQAGRQTVPVARRTAA